MVDREGQLEGGKPTEFGIERVGEGEASNFIAWMLNGKRRRISPPVEGEGHDSHFHYMVTPTSSDAETLAISYSDQVSTISIHPGAAPASDGILSPLECVDGKTVGFIELKLHDDAGDLELWLCSDGAMSKPLDFP